MAKLKKQRLGKVQKAWIADLESRKYWQANGSLRKGRHHCCLGVACRTIGLHGKVDGDGWCVFGKANEAIVAPREVVEALALRSNSGRLSGQKLKGATTLIEANDDMGATFKDIAEFCRKHPDAVFTEPK